MNTVKADRNAIAKAFEQSQSKNRPAFIPFIMGGYPTIEDTVDIALTLQEAGADLLEVGFPYSDPAADGPVIQQAAKEALESGMTFTKGLELISDMRKKGVHIPILVFTYYNPVLQYGLERFVEKAIQAGANGALIPDLPYEEVGELKEIASPAGFAIIPFVAPTSKQRMSFILNEAEGFVYCISTVGVTGVRESMDEQIKPLLSEIRQRTDIPIAVGFGVSKKEHFDFLAPYADGVIVGSAIVHLIANEAERYSQPEGKKEALQALKTFVEELVSK